MKESIKNNVSRLEYKSLVLLNKACKDLKECDSKKISDIEELSEIFMKDEELEQDEELLVNLYKEYANASNIIKLRVD